MFHVYILNGNWAAIDAAQPLPQGAEIVLKNTSAEGAEEVLAFRKFSMSMVGCDGGCRTCEAGTKNLHRIAEMFGGEVLLAAQPVDAVDYDSPFWQEIQQVLARYN